ncbi:hypothetical protein GCM10023340_03150 [Nocardioides marinquilinus]|uniref:SecDF P1 head subdomain domain-containing protein n=1 Tax=Nocardioides marinquilinus TaxID=1210400 RepID=A0ABP9P660_9ACTN
MNAPTRAVALGTGCLLAALVLAGCSGGGAASGDAGGTSSSSGSATAVDEGSGRAPGPVQVRLVRGGPDRPAAACADDGRTVPPECDVAGLDCADPARTPARDPMAACAAGDPDARYVLDPAEAVGGVLQARAGEVPGGGWQVLVTFGGRSRDELALLSNSLSGTTEQVAFVVDGQVVSTASFVSPIDDGRLQLTGDFTEEQARELAGVLLAGG